MRALLAKLLAVVPLVVLAAAPVARAEPVRVAVVGFTGDLPGPALAELAQSVRASLERQANKDVLAVVSREEMGIVYRLRGAPCRPDDLGCVVEASDAWGGRLFVRGVVRTTSEGIIIGATLESVRMTLVAAAQTPAATAREIGTAVPVLVRELLDGEKAYRERMLAAAPAPLAAGPLDPASAELTAAPAQPARRCRAVALQEGAVPGELFVEDEGLRFESSPAAARQLHWRYRWDRVARVDDTRAAGSPALSLESTTKDKLVVSFTGAAERDSCFALIAARRKPVK